MATVGEFRPPSNGVPCGRPVTSDVLLLGAAGSSGRLIAAELAARGLSIRLAGRHLGPLQAVARELSADGVASSTAIIDTSDAASLAWALDGVGVVVSTIGPFAGRAGPVIDACLTARTPYVDIANEWPAVKGLLDRDDLARALEVPLITGAGFGPAATEMLVLRLVERIGTAPTRVRVAAAAHVSRQGDGVRQTIRQSLPLGALTYRDGRLIREAIGSGATVLTFGGAQRGMLPGPVGDLEAARRASGAPNVVAYIPDPAAPTDGTDSCAWAEVVGRDGDTIAAELVVGDGLHATAAVAAETARRVLAGAAPGAWTPGQLFGPDLFTDATGAKVTIVDEEPARTTGGS